ncbi:MAG: TolC family protein [Bacillota bacterium]
MRWLRLSIVAIMLTAGVFLGGTSYAATDTTEPRDGLSLSDAIVLALENNKELEQASLEVEVAKETRKEVWETYNTFLLQTYVPGQNMYVSIPTGEDPTGLVYVSNFNWEVEERNYLAKIDSVVAEVYKTYYGILQGLEDVKAKELTLRQKETRLFNTELRYKLGMESPTTLQGMQTEVATARAALTQARNELNVSYAEFAELLGLPVGERPSLTDQPLYIPLELEDPDEVIEEIAENTPAVWIAEEAVRLERYTYGMLHDYEVDKAELEAAKVSVEVAEEQMRQLIRNLHSLTASLEDSYASATEGLRLAEESLRVARLYYELGMSTRADLLAAEAALSEAKKGLLSLQCQHELMKMAFYKPWTAGVVLGSSTETSSGTSS